MFSAFNSCLWISFQLPHTSPTSCFSGKVGCSRSAQSGAQWNNCFTVPITLLSSGPSGPCPSTKRSLAVSGSPAGARFFLPSSHVAGCLGPDPCRVRLLFLSSYVSTPRWSDALCASWLCSLQQPRVGPALRGAVGLPIAVAALAERGLQRTQASGPSAGSAAAAPKPSCPSACGIFQNQEWNPRLLYWQADPPPLSQQGRPCFGHLPVPHIWLSSNPLQS